MNVLAFAPGKLRAKEAEGRALPPRAQGLSEREQAARRDGEAAAERGRRALRDRDLLQAVARHAGSTCCVEDALRFALAEVCARTGWGLGCAYRPASSGPPRLVPMAVRHLADGGMGAFLAADGAAAFPPGVGLPGRVWAAGLPLWAADGACEGDPGRRAAASICGLRAGLAFPVLLDEEVVAVGAVFARGTQRPDPALLGLLGEVGREVGHVVARARGARRPAPEATDDDAMGEPNRSLLLDRLDAAAALGRPGAVLLFELDVRGPRDGGHGHAARDRLLAAAGARLAALVRAAAGPEHVVAWLGGDEFAVLLDGIGAAGVAEDLAGALRRALAEPFDVGGRASCVLASAGVAASGPGRAVARATMAEAHGALRRAGPFSARRRGAERGR